MARAVHFTMYNIRSLLVCALSTWAIRHDSFLVCAWTPPFAVRGGKSTVAVGAVHIKFRKPRAPSHPVSRVYLRNGASLKQASIAETPGVVEKLVPMSGTDASTDLSTGNTVRPSAEYQLFGRQLLNALLLAVSFGYAAYTILNIDSGMSRGWTQSEIAMRIPFDTWSSYEASLAEKPVFTKTLINVVIYLLGDWLSQTVFQRKNLLDFDPARTLRNGFIGLCFGPLVHKYYEFSDYILPLDCLVNRIEKIVMDQTVYLTVKASIYVAAVGLLAGDDVQTVKTNVQERIPSIVFTAWKFWPLVHCITYGVIPARHRILWVNCVDLVWNAILATMSRSQSDEKKMEAEQEEFLELMSVETPVVATTVAINTTESDPLYLSEILHHQDHHEHEGVLLQLIDAHNTTTTLTQSTLVLTDDENDDNTPNRGPPLSTVC